jgi:hypothetical protein
MDIRYTALVIATIMNIADAVTSLIAFSVGFSETNGFMGIVHNSVIAMALAVLVFQAITLIAFAISMKYKPVCAFTLTWGLIKTYAILHNTLLLLHAL